jgi:monoamine oxidase
MQILIKLIFLGLCLGTLSGIDAAKPGRSKRLASVNSRVVIVGGGVAGLSAALRLKERNFKNVVILEGSDRLGGRINTVAYSKTLIL